MVFKRGRGEESSSSKEIHKYSSQIVRSLCVRVVWKPKE